MNPRVCVLCIKKIRFLDLKGMVSKKIYDSDELEKSGSRGNVIGSGRAVNPEVPQGPLLTSICHSYPR